MKLHADYGGVVPELASRDYVRKTVPDSGSLKKANLTAKDIDAVAYTAGPGLVGALLVAQPWALAGVCLERAGHSGTPYGRSPSGANAGRCSA
ncbi:hypothetical protein ACNKHQ_17800 [Shigella flexneri]